MGRQETLRRCKVCGSFYPAVAADLERDLAGLLGRVKVTRPPGAIRGIIAPHAGYQYSGLTAAHAYALLAGGSYAAVVVVAPSHREYFDGVSVYSGDAYETPLGTLPVDVRLRELLRKETGIVRVSAAGHGAEHAIEVQLPFLQHQLAGFSLLPVVMGDQRREYCLELGRALAAVLAGGDVLVVASTDLSHYHASSEARKLDKIVVDDVARLDPESLMDHLEGGEAEACGGGPTVAVMAALRTLGFHHMTVLHQCNSGDITGETASVVGYLSAACS